MHKKKNKNKTPLKNNAPPSSAMLTWLKRSIIFLITLVHSRAYFIYDQGKTWLNRKNPITVHNSNFALNTHTNRMGTFEISNRSDIPIYGITVVVKLDNPLIHHERLSLLPRKIGRAPKLPKEYADINLDTHNSHAAK